MDLAVGGIDPSDRAFFDFIPKELSDKQKLNVKAKSKNGLPGKNFPDSLSPKTFKPALGIFEIGHEQQSNHPIKNTSHVFSM